MGREEYRMTTPSNLGELTYSSGKVAYPRRLLSVKLIFGVNGER